MFHVCLYLKVLSVPCSLMITFNMHMHMSSGAYGLNFAVAYTLFPYLVSIENEVSLLTYVLPYVMSTELWCVSNEIPIA